MNVWETNTLFANKLLYSANEPRKATKTFNASMNLTINHRLRTLVVQIGVGGAGDLENCAYQCKNPGHTPVYPKLLISQNFVNLSDLPAAHL